MNAQVEPDLDSQAKAYARGELTSYLLNDGYKPTGFHTYTDATGLPIYWKVRLRHDRKGKTLRAFARNDGRIHSKTNQPYQGQFMPCEPSNAWQAAYPQGNGKKPLYRLHELFSNHEPLVFIVEGEQKADALAKLGLIATTSGSTGSVNTTYWQVLAGCTVRIWRDNDDAGIKYQDEVKAVLESLSCVVSVVDVDALALPVKGDVIDWLAVRDGVSITMDDVLGLALIDTCEQNACARDEGKEGYFKASDAVSCEADQVTDEVTGETPPHEEPEPDLETDLKRLASLSFIDYERCRDSEAKRLKVRSSVLDKLIKPYKVDEETEASGSDMFATVEPWDGEVDGVALLDEVALIIHRHIVCEKPTIHATTLWIAFSWCIDVMHVSPIACITAPEKRCGKTQLLNLIGMLCMKPLPASNITAAALFRSIEAFEPTLLIDEADAFLGQNEELRGIINSGHTRQSAFVIRTVGDNHEPKRFSTWGAKAISGIGHLSDTLKDRSILLELRRKQPNEQRDRLRHADTRQFEQVKRKLARWAINNMEALRIARPALPEALNDRAQDNWESLLAIADRVGGHWSKTARHAAMSISGIEDEAPSINEELLADIKQVFEKMRVSRISSSDLLEHLCGDDEAPWIGWNKGRPLTLRQLGRRLGEFNIASKPLRDASGVFRGYELDDFKETFLRYIKAVPNHSTIPSVTALQPSHSKAFSDIPSVTNTHDITLEKRLEPLPHKVCNGVTLENTTTPEKQNNAAPVTDNSGSLFI